MLYSKLHFPLNYFKTSPSGPLLSEEEKGNMLAQH